MSTIPDAANTFLSNFGFSGTLNDKLKAYLESSSIYSDRDSLVSSLSERNAVDGVLYSDGQVLYIGSTGATSISDAPNLKPFSSITPNHFGKNETPGTTDMTAAIQAAIDYCATFGGGTVHLGPYTYAISDTLILKSGVYLEGAGTKATSLFLLSGSNKDMIKSEDFDTLTGTSAWYVIADGVPYQFGLRRLRLDGNRGTSGVNNSTGAGVKFFGKRYVIEDVIIVNTAEDGFYSECGTNASVLTVDDLPECRIDNLSIRTCGGDGFYFAGPHDGYISSLDASNCNGRCIVIDSGGTCDIGWMHAYGGGKNIDTTGTYSADQPAVYLNDSCRAGVVIAESAATNCLKIGSGIDAVQIGVLRAFQGNKRSGGDALVLMEGTNCGIADGKLTDDNNGGGLKVTGNGNRFKGYIQASVGSTGTGVEISSSLNHIEAEARNFTGTGGTGIKTTTGNRNFARINTLNCETGWNNSASGTYGNDYNFNIQVPNSGGTRFTGNGPGATDRWDVYADLATPSSTTARYAKVTNRIPATSVDLNDTSAQNITFDHYLLDGLTPAWGSIRASLVNPSTTTGLLTSQITIVPVSVSSTQIQVQVRTDTALGAGETAQIAVEYSA